MKETGSIIIRMEKSSGTGFLTRGLFGIGSDTGFDFRGESVCRKILTKQI